MLAMRINGQLPPELDVSLVPRGGLTSWRVKRAIAYMRDHLDQDISVQDLAAVVHLSRFHFCRAFRLATGSTPHETLTRLRIDESRRLLASSNQSISEIALPVGFQTPSAFAGCFRKTVGKTPRAYRRSQRRMATGAINARKPSP
jgi:AraC family transcriptional regulator